MVRADVSLSFDPGDLGSYQDYTTSSAFCYSCLCYFIYGAVSQAFANNAAYPVNFTQAASSALGSGQLLFLYQWQSSSKNPADLADCQVGEFVTYPGYVQGQQGLFLWPNPPWPSSSNHNPNIDSVAGNNSYCPWGTGSGTAPCLVDTQYHGVFGTSYTDAGFPAQQKWWYSCPGVSGGSSVDLTVFTTIQRSVTHSGSTYTYTITKGGASASCVLGQTCTGS